MSPGAQANAAKFPRQAVRLPYPRSKTGCLVCRRQRKKCDERRPTCSRCLSKMQTCQWPGTARRQPSPDRTSSVHEDAPLIQDHASDTNPCEEEISPPTSTLNEDAGPAEDDQCLMAPLGCSLGSVSSMFLAHFVAETSRYMTLVTPEKNPILTHMLPLAFSDDLILHSLLALGGAHLQSKQGSPEINTWVCQHYGRVIYKLQDTISRESSKPVEWLRALLALLILYLIGVFGSVQDGAVMMHIQAAQNFVPKLLNTPLKTTNERTLCGLTLELYTYLALIASPTPYNNGKALEPDTRNSFLPSWDTIRTYGTFGIIVSPMYQCLEVIPRVVNLCTRRQTEMIFGECSSESWEEFFQITDIIESIGFVDDLLESSIDAENRQSSSVSAVYRHALAIFVNDAMWCGATQCDESQLSIIHQHALSALEIIPALLDTDLSNVLLWPTVVIGSCLHDEGERRIIRSALSTKEPIYVVTKTKTILEHLWAENNPVYFGPYGLHKQMLSNQANLCLG